MKGGADISDQMAIKRAVEAGIADANLLSRQLLVPVDCVQSYIDHYSKTAASPPAAEPIPEITVEDENTPRVDKQRKATLNKRR